MLLYLSSLSSRAVGVFFDSTSVLVLLFFLSVFPVSVSFIEGVSKYYSFQYFLYYFLVFILVYLLLFFVSVRVPGVRGSLRKLSGVFACFE